MASNACKRWVINSPLLKQVFVAFYFVCSCLIAPAQLVLDQTQSAEQLVDSVLTGSGILPQNITFNGQPGSIINSQIAYFTSGYEVFGLERGIILATGNASVAVGPNNSSTAFIALAPGNQLNEEPDLQEIVAPAAIRDVAVLEFDFQALGDTLQLRYVFASEEYNDHTCSVYNDAFGFFISGPGITGSYTNQAKNVALIPGTNVPVAINTVNLGVAGQYGSDAVCNDVSPSWQSNSAYYVNNEGNTDPNTTQYDGYTVPMQIKIPVICGETYRIKIAVADAVDNKNDSAVLIEAQSLGSSAPLEATGLILNPQQDGAGLEGCSSLQLFISRRDSSQAETIFLRSSGLDNAAQILPGMPDQVDFMAGQGSMGLEIPLENDNELHGTRSFEIQVLKPASCGLDTAVFNLNYTIYDVDEMLVDYDAEIWLECTATGSVSITPTGGNPPYSITWDQEEYVGFEPEINPPSDTLLTAIVTDACDLHTQNIQIQVEREHYAPMIVTMPGEVLFDCFTPVQVTPVVSDGSGDRTYLWLLEGEPISNEAVLSHTLTAPGIIALQVEDRCVEMAAGSVMATYSMPAPTVWLGPDTTGNCAENMIVFPIVEGGYNPLSYKWFKNGSPVSTEALYTFQPQKTTNISLKVSDLCGRESEDAMLVFVFVPTLHANLPAVSTVCKGQALNLTAEVLGGYGRYSYDWVHSGGTSQSVSFIPQHDSEYLVVVTDECGQSASASTIVEIAEIEAHFEFDYYSLHNKLKNYSTPGCTYTWSYPDGSTSDLYDPPFEPEWGETAALMLHVENDMGCEDDMVRFYDPPMSVFIPSAFTPDGDGHNDFFKAEGDFISSFQLMVFDRWGNLVFETDDITKGWNGSGAPGSGYSATDEVYSYKYTARAWSGSVEERTGMVTLLR